MVLENILISRGMTRNQLALKSSIAPSDLYGAMSGKRPFYPAWRQRVAACLGMDQREVFPEFLEGVGEQC